MKLTRVQFAKFLTELPNCIVAMEACASAHHWGREAEALGLTVRLVPAIYVKPFVRRQKNDAADAEAIAEAALRPSMRFFAVKTEAQQAQAVVFRSRELLVKQRTQLINALRGHLAEFGILLPDQRASVARMLAACRELGEDKIAPQVHDMVRTYADQIETLTAKVTAIDASICKDALKDGETRRLRTMPGVGPVTAMAIRAFCPEAQSFENRRAFAAWLGLVPRQHSTGGRTRLGRITKMG